MRERLPEQYQQIPDDALFPGMLEQIIDQTLLAKLKSADPAADPAEVKLYLENERRGTLAALVVQNDLGDGPDEAAVQAAYDAGVADFTPAPEFNASHILVATEAEALALKDQIDGGADFAELAVSNSTDPGSGANGGELGWFAGGQMVPEFDAAVAAMAVGDVSEPVQSQFGWHVIKLNEIRDTSPPPLDQVRGEIETQLRQEALQARLAELRSGAQIEMVETDVPPAAIRETDLLGD
jgi:peptidyl-prolyl cis-trans isomerase C